MPTRSAIVTTLRDADDVLDSFVTYHLGIGFDHIFLFFDDPSAKIPRAFVDHPQITARSRGLALERAWETTSLFLSPPISRSIEDNVMTRQVLNAELALRDAFYKKIDWLLHIDIDELFYLPGRHVTEHFADLNRRKIEVIKYFNLEGVVEQRRISDFFREVTLFKINPARESNKALIQQHKPLLQTVPQIPPSYFHYYTSGKSAVKVRPSSLPKGVHTFSTPAHGKSAIADSVPVILHYPCCGIDHFVQKHRTLGAFQRWFSDDKPIEIKAHLSGRDVVGSGDEQSIDAYYEENFVYSDASLVETLIDAGLLVRISEPAVFLQSVQKQHK